MHLSIVMTHIGPPGMVSHWMRHGKLIQWRIMRHYKHLVSQILTGGQSWLVRHFTYVWYWIGASFLFVNGKSNNINGKSLKWLMQTCVMLLAMVDTLTYHSRELPCPGVRYAYITNDWCNAKSANHRIIHQTSSLWIKNWLSSFYGSCFPLGRQMI